MPATPASSPSEKTGADASQRIKKKRKRSQIQKAVSKSVEKRHRAERRFQLYGMGAIAISLLFLLVLFCKIISSGYSAFFRTEILVPVTFAESIVQPNGDGNYSKILHESLKSLFPEVKGRSELFSLYTLTSKHAALSLRERLMAQPELLGTTQNIWLPASSSIDMLVKGAISKDLPEHQRSVNNKQISMLETLTAQGRIQRSFNTVFFTSGDSREPESAGILGGLIGSLFVIASCMALAFPLGVLTAIYLEEFAPKNHLTQLIEVNINNLAAVPSIVFGLLGLSVYIHLFGIPRSASLAGGLTLAMMALPVIVIATRTALRAVPGSIRDAAVALGASRVQTTFHHILPLAMPGVMTGAILSIARVLGETAPLLMIGMVAFIVDIPHHLLSPASALPVQVYLWSDSAEAGFIEKTSAAIIVLLLILAVINTMAAWLRKKFEVRW